MGKNNKARRAAKARAKARNRPRGGSGGFGHHRRSSSFGGGGGVGHDGPLFTDEEHVRGLLWVTSQSHREGDPAADQGLAMLAELPPALVDPVIEMALVDQISLVWQGGWQPSELLRQARRGSRSSAGARLLAHAIATDHAGRRSSTLDSRWVAQVESLDLPAADGRSGWVRRWARDEQLDRREAVAVVVDALATLGLPRLDPVLPPPGSSPSAAARASAGPGSTGATNDPVLERIRALLAKAESTTFEAEALTFTAKAQELMTRHAIDAALLDAGGSADRDAPITIRVPIDPPYADAKSWLLQVVAEAGRCRAVFHNGLDLESLIGFADDVASVELLFTSLLVQAQTALSQAARSAPAGTRVRSQGYRSAFLLSFAERIGERLREINDEVYATVEADQGGAFLPALRSRLDKVDAAVTERFGELISSRVRGGYDAAGWSGGRLAADNAQLAFGNVTAAAS